MNVEPSANGFVKLERERRGLSVREAASAGGISNETWGRYEHTGHLTPKMRQAIARAFHLTPDTTECLLRGESVPAYSDGEDVLSRLDALDAEVRQLQAHSDEWQERVLSALAELSERLGRLELPGEQATDDG